MIVEFKINYFLLKSCFLCSPNIIFDLLDHYSDILSISIHHFYKKFLKIYQNVEFSNYFRNPISNYESIFGFFRDYPFAQWVGRNGTLKTFLSDPAAFYDRSTPWYFR